MPTDSALDSAFTTWVMQGIHPSGATLEGPPTVPRAKLGAEDYVRGVLSRDPGVLGRAITLMESDAPAHIALAQEVLAGLLPHTGKARRIGLTGIPGAGKSIFIEAFGLHLVSQGHRVAVLAIDPSSAVTGGSILADKVRMERLSRHPDAFIRPSPSGGSLGGVTRKTREAILVCEAAGHDVIIVETVGVGQSEVTVRAMVDAFVVLLIAGAGDEMQGIKKGVIEMADLLVINKADGDNRPRCLAALAEMRQVLNYLRAPTEGWRATVQTASALQGEGVGELWETLGKFFATGVSTGALSQRRREQSVAWMHALVEESLRTEFYGTETVRNARRSIEARVEMGSLAPLAGAMELLAAGGR